MDRALPEDVPIEARMVTRAIERAQNTVEQRNAEIRKDVLKYDEVMNAQRKVIYERRMQVIDGEDLHERTFELLDEKVAELVATCCPSEFAEEWDLERLVAEMRGSTTRRSSRWPTSQQATSTDQLIESIYAEAAEYYEARGETFPGGPDEARELERQVMLQIIDQRWRFHLSEMDYLREGIHLRSLAQTDPLVAWQREGFEMFGQLMTAIDDDYLRYVMHIQVLPTEEAAPDFRQATYEAADRPGRTRSALAGTEVAGEQDPAGVPCQRGARPPACTGDARRRRAATRATKLGRNDPCWCGSGRKYKLCHGKT